MEKVGSVDVDGRVNVPVNGGVDGKPGVALLNGERGRRIARPLLIWGRRRWNLTTNGRDADFRWRSLMHALGRQPEGSQKLAYSAPPLVIRRSTTGARRPSGNGWESGEKEES